VEMEVEVLMDGSQLVSDHTVQQFDALLSHGIHSLL
jgi:hypothetical protein